MVWVGRKAQVLARRGMDIRRGNHPSRRSAFSAVLTRVAYTSPSPWTAQRVDVLVPTAVFHVMQAVLYPPVVADYSKQFPWSAPPGTQAAQQIPALPAHLPGGYVYRLLLHHHPLPRPRKPQLIPDIASQCPIGPDTPFLNHARFFSTVSASGSTSSALVEYASHHVQHMHKALTQMNVKLQHIIRDITGKTGMDIIEAIVGGERDPRKLARLRDRRIKADEATIAKSLQGHWREEHIFELTQALELYRVYRSKIAECDREIEARLERFEDRSDGKSPAPNGNKRNQGNAPRFDVQGHLYRMTGSGPDPDRRGGRFHGVEGGQRDWHRHDEMGERKALRVLAGAQSRQPHHWRQGDQLANQTQCQPGSHRLALGGLRAAPLQQRPGGPSCAGRKHTWERPRPSPPRRTSWRDSSAPCCASGRTT